MREYYGRLAVAGAKLLQMDDINRKAARIALMQRTDMYKLKSDPKPGEERYEKRYAVIPCVPGIRRRAEEWMSMGDTARATKLLKQSFSRAVQKLQKPAKKVLEQSDDSEDELLVRNSLNADTDSTEEADTPDEA